MSKERIVSVIDIGSSKVATLVAQIGEEQLQIVGISSVGSRGIKKGVVVDIDQAVEAIAQSLEGAERMAGYAVSSAYVVADGQHLSSVNSSGVVAVSSADEEIGHGDVERVIEAARAITIPSSREIIHVIPRHFVVDAQEGVHDPVGMSGVRLQVETHIISGATTTLRNLVKCINQVGVEIEDLVFGGVAAAESVLTETERELGVALLDIGGGTTDLVLFYEGSPAHSSVLSMGGKNITNDIAIGLRISLEDAEKVKIHLSNYQTPTQPGKETPGLPEEMDIGQLGIANLQKIETKFIKEGIVKPRLEEILEEVGREIKKSGLEGLAPAGVVLTGGASQTVGLLDVAKRVLRMPGRLGKPSGVSGLIEEASSPAYAASVGAVIFASKFQGRQRRGILSLSRVNLLPRMIDLAKEGWNRIKGYLP